VSVQPALPTSYQTATPAPITRLGSLFVAAANPARKLLNATIDAFCEATVTLLKSRDHDAEHDAYQLSVDRLTKLGIKNAMVKGCGCERGFIAIGIDNGKAMVADELEDGLIVLTLTITRRWSRALEKALKLRKCRRQRAGKGGAR
jgi:hypothetical protein